MLGLTSPGTNNANDKKKKKQEYTCVIYRWGWPNDI